MPIASIDEQVARTHALPLIGRLHKGEGGGHTEPRDLDYFRVAWEQGYEHLQPYFVGLFGDAPASIGPIFLTGETTDDAFDYWMEEWDVISGVLNHRCNEEHRVLWRDGTTYNDTPIQCLTAMGRTCGCKRRGTLHFYIPGLETQTGVLGRWILKTRSLRDIVHLSATMRMLNTRYLSQGYRLSDIPLVLRRLPQEIPTQQGKTITYLVQLDVHDSFVSKLQVLPAVKNLAEGDTDTDYYRMLVQQRMHLHDLEDIAEAYGYANAQSFIRSLETVPAIEQAIMDFAAENSATLLAYSMQAERQAGNRYRYYFDVGFGTVVAYSRTPFRNAGYEPDEWRETETPIVFKEPVVLTAKKANERYDLDRVLDAVPF